MGSSGSRSDVRASSDRSAGRQQRRRQDHKHALIELAYYHSHVSNSDEALKVLCGQPVGSYILRNCSGKHKGVCAASVVVERDNDKHSDRTLRHLDICLHNGSFFFERKRPFKTLQALVDYYGKHDVPNSRGIAGVRLSIPFEKVRSRPMRDLPPLPADAISPKQVGEAADSSLQSQQPMSALMYSYARHPDHTDILITYLEQQEQQQRQQSSRRGPRSVSESSGANGRCACGILVSDAALPGGWTIHQNVRERVVFYKDAGGVSHWTLPAEIDRLLSDQQRDFIEQLTDRVKSGNGYGINP